MSGYFEMLSIKKRIIMLGFMVSVLFLVLSGKVLAKGTTFFYEQLTTAQKAYYNAVLKSDLKKGKKTPILIGRSKEDVTSDIEVAVTAFSEDHAEIFWAGTTYFTSRKADDGYWEYYLRPIFHAGFTEKNTSSCIKSAEKAVKKVVSAASKKKTVYDKLVYVHDWLTKNNAYNTKTLGNNSMFPWSAYSALISKYSPICEGYSKAFKMICDRLNIPCVLVSNDSHMWNYVRVSGKWYAVDVTYDDPVVGNSKAKVSGLENKKYFLVGRNTKIGSKAFIKNHNPETSYLVGDLKLPVLQKSKYSAKKKK